MTQATLFDNVGQPEIPERERWLMRRYDVSRAYARKLLKGSDRHAQMVMAHGGLFGENCRNCRHFLLKHHSDKYSKCGLAGISRGRATDWSGRWAACGLFERKEPS